MTLSQLLQAILDEQGYVILQNGGSYKPGDVVTNAKACHTSFPADSILPPVVVIGFSTREDYERQHRRYGIRAPFNPRPPYLKVVAE